MDIKDLEKYVPLDWLDQYEEEYIHLAERITKVIMMTEAQKKGWKSPLKTLADFEAFIQSESEDKNMPVEKVRAFLMDAGKIKARNSIFDTHFYKNLPINAEGKCIIPRKTIMAFIKYSIDDRKRETASH